MFALKNILVVIDPDRSDQPTLDKALQLANHGDSKLELLLCDHSNYLEDGYYFDPIQAQELRKEQLEKHRQFIELLALPLREQGFSVSTDVRWGKPRYEEIIHKVLETSPDILIHNTSQHEKISRFLLSQQDWQLIRYCPCPLMLVKGKAWKVKPVIIASIDPNHIHDKPASLDYKITQTARYLTDISSGELHLFHSYYLPPLSGMYPITADKKICEETTEGLRADFSVEKGNLHLSSEEIQHSLPDIARELDASIVVMGAISRSRLDQVFIGNTAERVLDELACDVIVVKPDGFVTPIRKLALT